MITARHFRSNVARVHHPWGTHCVMPFKVAGVGKDQTFKVLQTQSLNCNMSALTVQ